QVGGVLIAVHIGVRDPLEQVPQVPVGGGDVARPPGEQRGHAQLADALGEALGGGSGGLGGAGGGVGDEVLDALAAVAAAVRGEVGLLDVPGQGGARQRQGRADEGVGQRGGRGQHGRGGGQLQGARQTLADLLVDAGVAQDHPGQVV